MHVHIYVCTHARMHPCTNAGVHSGTLHATCQVPVARYAMQPGWMTGVAWSPVGEALLASTDAPAIVLQLLQAPRTPHTARRTPHAAHRTPHTAYAGATRTPCALVHTCIRGACIRPRARARTTGHEGGIGVQPRHGGEQHLLRSVGALAQRVRRLARRGELRRAARGAPPGGHAGRAGRRRQHPTARPRRRRTWRCAWSPSTRTQPIANGSPALGP